MVEEWKDDKVWMNPYVVQADRFAMSLRHLGERFLRLEKAKEQFSREEVLQMGETVRTKVCESCDKREICMKEDEQKACHMVEEILCAVELYGTELHMELKKKMQRQCVRAPRFFRETLEVFEQAKKEMIWTNKVVQKREQCILQMDDVAQMLQHTIRELDASIFQDPPLEKKIRSHFKRAGIRTLSMVFFVNAKGRYEIHSTVKVERGRCVTTKTVAAILAKCTGKRMCVARGERAVIGQEYGTVVCVEGPLYYTLHGIARVGKECSNVSGDSFDVLQLPGGQEAAIISDGMGAGDLALQESSMVIEMLDELLTAGFPANTAISMLNMALVMGREDVQFSTLDLALFNLYTGECEFWKSGAATTFVRRADKVEHIYSESLPLGVVQNLEVEMVKRKMNSGDVVIMVSDGVLDELPPGEQEQLMDFILQGCPIENPRELAQYILKKVLELGKKTPGDDMTILVAGIWDICYNIP